MVFLIAAIALALIYDLVNGFHNASNSIATVVSTRALTPAKAIYGAVFFNFIPIFIFPFWVADTVYAIISINGQDPNYLSVVSCGLIGAILWDALTWRFGIPSSSSHSLIGGLAGAGITYAGLGILNWVSFVKIVLFMLLTPLLSFLLGFFLMILIYWFFRGRELTEVDHLFRNWQLLSASLFSLGNGAVNGQKTMGVIMALLLANGTIAHGTLLSLGDPSTNWVILIAQLGLTLGTAFGGWRIVETMGFRITKLRSVGGFSTEAAGACTLFSAIFFGIPVSPSHIVTTAIIGTSTAVNRAARTNWITAFKIIWAWMITIPAAALIAAGAFRLIFIFKNIL